MNIIFLGEDTFSSVVLNALISSENNVLAVYCPYYENKIYMRLKMICEKNNIKFHRTKNINSDLISDEITLLEPDLIVVSHFERILKNNIIQIPKYGCINLHPSILPNYRGLSPQHWPIINGDSFTGITVHFINEGIDTGDIIRQRLIEIEPSDYVSDLQLKMKNNYGSIVLEAISDIKLNKVRPVIQNSKSGSYYGKLKNSDCQIDSNGSVFAALNLVRGVSFPYQGAEYNGYKIWKAKLASNEFVKKWEILYSENGLYFVEELGDFIKFKDGFLIIEKYSKL